MGQKTQKFVRNTFLVTRHVRDNLTLMFASMYEGIERIELQPAYPSQGKRPRTTIIAFWLRVRVR